ncbi:cytochrome P450 [Vararia minispora EC-137]|uniref:Cytochrome P450 n=1 Tax=Vararia minispora EC-137 TaxID=1314806 RepID=A0ACB8QXJ8_9AGAM|nr:cytochrome P450 [Vararia minispora EC-137]
MFSPLSFAIEAENRMHLLVAAACAAIAMLTGLRLFFIRRNTFPPGPRPQPLIGNALDLLNMENPWEKFTEWKEQYGDVVGLRALGTDIIILNSMQAFKDLLDKRSSKYSHRPVFTVVCKLMKMGESMPLRDQDQEWREMRKLSHTALGPTPVKQYYRMQEDMAAIFAREVMDDPANYRNALRAASSRFILSITYGMSVRAADNKYINHAEHTMDIIRQSIVLGAYLCDLMPWMQYLPSWLPFQRRAAAGRKMVDIMITKPFERVKQDITEGKARPSIALDIFSGNQDELSQQMYGRALWTTASMYAAGAESTFATILTFILAMVLWPEKQSRAQQELDAVLGYGQLPAVSDRERLPYIEAVMKETMRWNPMLPLGKISLTGFFHSAKLYLHLGFPRRTSQADEYNGLHIPAGAIVIPNVWAIAREHNGVYSPHEFHPERFLDATSTATDPGTWAFGFGRRICPGKLLGENNIFIMMSTLLAAFEMSAPDEKFVPPKFIADLGRYASSLPSLVLY